MVMMLDMGREKGEEREKGVLLAKPLAGGGAAGGEWRARRWTRRDTGT